MIKEINMVADFHRLFGQPILTTPTIPSMDRASLRLELIKEELKETTEAVEVGDLIETIDGVADMLYVVFGFINEFGLGGKIEEVFNEVHRSNMSKACATIEEAEATVDHYLNLDNTESYIKESGDTFLVYRTSDDKVLKSVNYSKANIQQFL